MLEQVLKRSSKRLRGASVGSCFQEFVQVSGGLSGHCQSFVDNLEAVGTC